MTPFQTLLGLNSFYLLGYGCRSLAIGPGTAAPKLLASLSEKDKYVKKVRKIFGDACVASGVPSASVRLDFHQSGKVLDNRGRQSFTILSMHSSLIEGRSALDSKDPQTSFEVKIYREQLALAPDEPSDLVSHFRSLSEMHYIFSTYKSKLQPTDDELYFFFKHELAGHVHHQDNLKRVVLLVLTATVFFTAWSVFESMMGVELSWVALPVMLCALDILFRCVRGTFMKSQEFHADLVAIKDDPRALRGALLYLKKETVKELREQGVRTRVITEISKEQSSFWGTLTAGFYRTKDWLVEKCDDHPHYLERYQAVWKSQQS